MTEITLPAGVCGMMLYQIRSLEHSNDQERQTYLGVKVRKDTHRILGCLEIPYLAFSKGWLYLFVLPAQPSGDFRVHFFKRLNIHILITS